MQQEFSCQRGHRWVTGGSEGLVGGNICFTCEAENARKYAENQQLKQLIKEAVLEALQESKK